MVLSDQPRLLATDLTMETHLLTRVVSRDITAVVALAGVMCPSVDLAEMIGNEIVDACLACLVQVRQCGQEAIRVLRFHPRPGLRGAFVPSVHRSVWRSLPHMNAGNGAA